MNKGMSGLEDSIESGKQISDFGRGYISLHEIFKTIVILSSSEQYLSSITKKF